MQVVAERSDVPPDAPIAEYIEGGPGFCEPLPLVVTVGIVPSACPLYFGSRLRLFKQPSDATSVEIDARHGTTSILGWGALLLDLAPSWSFSLPDELGEAYARRVLRARIARALGSAVAN